jgi:hypothetical protein
MAETTDPPAGGLPVAKAAWRKGNLRSDEAASSCRHLEFSMLTEIRMLQARNQRRVATPHDNGQEIVNVPTMGPVQPLALTCQSPDMIAIFQTPLPPPLKPALKALKVSLEICRLCPFWSGQ